jgi:hypothetical protein
METISNVTSFFVEFLAVATGMPTWASWIVVVLIGGTVTICMAIASLICFVKAIPAMVGNVATLGFCLVFAGVIGFIAMEGSSDKVEHAPKAEQVYDDEATNDFTEQFYNNTNK